MNDVLNDFLDLGLVQAGIELFARQNKYSDWLVPKSVTPRPLTVKEFRELALTTEDEKEINSIAFFCWTCHFSFRTFAGRLCKRIAKRGSYDVFSSVMLLVQPDIPKNSRDVFLEALAEHPGSTVFEVVVSLLAVKDSVSEVTIGRLLSLAMSIMQRNKKPDIYQNGALYNELVLLGSTCSEAPSILKVFNKLLGRVPKETSSLVAEAGEWGFTYSDVLKLLTTLCFLQDTAYNYSSQDRLVNKLIDVLFEKPSTWTEDEVLLVERCRRHCYGYKKREIVCASNIRFAMDSGFTIVIGLNCRNCEALLGLEPAELLDVLVSSIDVEAIQTWHEKFCEAFKHAFLFYKKGAQDLYNCICSLELECYKEFTDYWASYLSFFDDHAAFDLLQQLEFGTTAYCNLMQHYVKYSKVLNEEENEILEKEVLKYVLAMCPDKYSKIFEEEVIEDGDDEECYDDDDGYDDEYCDEDEDY